MRKLLLALMLAVLIVVPIFSGCGDAESQDPPTVTWAWHPPTGGTQWVGFRIEQWVDDGSGPVLAQSWPAWADTTLVVPLVQNAKEQLIVAAYDAHGRLGPQAVSIWYEDFGGPGSPGVPTRTVNP